MYLLGLVIIQKPRPNPNKVIQKHVIAADSISPINLYCLVYKNCFTSSYYL